MPYSSIEDMIHRMRIAIFKHHLRCLGSIFLLERKPFPILLWREVPKCVRRSFFVKETDVIRYLFRDVLR